MATDVQRDRVRLTIAKFIGWLESYGETSFDHQSYYAGPIGRRAKELFYRSPWLGRFAVSPMVISEAILPSARKLFWRRMRLPIADAHFAMGFASLYRETQNQLYYQRAVEFLNALIKTRSPFFPNYCWGYPFDWVTQKGIIKKDTPLITTTPYVYEAFESVYSIDKNAFWLDIMHSIAEHALLDIEDFPLSSDTASCGYFPGDKRGGVVNASAYRAFLLVRASVQFREPKYRERAERNLNFVLQTQGADGSWVYATDGTRDFIDHFHTCFILKALAKIEREIRHEGCRTALEKGVGFYTEELFDKDGLPKPFSKRPRLTVYRHELYDYAECLNIGILLNGRCQRLDSRTDHVLNDLLERWQKNDGSFRSRKLIFGWDNVPMHRWGQSQIFRSLCVFLCATHPENRRPGLSG
jgi:hypothetical protein